MQTYKFRLLNSATGHRVYLLAFIWTVGIIFGVMASDAFSFDYYSLMDRVLNASVSIVDLLVCAFLPFAFTLAALWLMQPGLLFILCFLKALALGVLWNFCFLCFGGAGWLIRGLLLFSQIASIPACWYLWILYCYKKPFPGKLSVGLLSIYLLIVTFLDYYLAAPFLRRLSS